MAEISHHEHVPVLASRDRPSLAATVRAILDSPEFSVFIRSLDDAYVTGRKGYSNRSLVGACLVKSLYERPFWSRTADLIADNPALHEALGDVPSIYAIYRFKEKLSREHANALVKCIGLVQASLKEKRPVLGTNVAIDASDLPAYANGMKYISKNGPERERFSDPDASWGHRSAVSTRKGGGFYGYKLHLAVCADTDLPLAWRVESGRHNETKYVGLLFEQMRVQGLAPRTATMDKAYDMSNVYEACRVYEVAPVIPLRETGDVKRGEHLPPHCEHGWMIFKGAEFARQRIKWACPTGECARKSQWLPATRLRPLIPSATGDHSGVTLVERPVWFDLRCGRASVERAFGRLKNDCGLTPLRTRGIRRVRLHVNLTILTALARALYRERAKAQAPPLPLAA